MADKSKIEWTDASWTPIRAQVAATPIVTARVGWHCEHISEGCRNCYAEGMNKRLGTGRPFKPGELRNGVKLFLDETMLLQPLRWKKPRKIFVCSMTDLFAGFVPDWMRDQMFAVMAMCQRHTFQIVTKRTPEMRAYFAARTEGDPWAEAADAIADAIGLDDHPFVLEPKHIPLPNVWLGTSVENQNAADKRIPELLATPAAVRFVSVEPMLGPIDLTNVPSISGRRVNALDPNDALVPVGGLRLDLVICGGESGPGGRDCDLDHVRSLRDQCVRADVPFLLKQLKIGGKLVKMPELDGKVWSEMP
jgi:protein gp37